MSVVAVLGAGAGGAAAVVELTRAGHQVRWWNRSPATLEPFRAAGGVAHEGVFGDGFVAPQTMVDDLGSALEGAEVAMVCLPSIAHAAVAHALVSAGVSIPLLLNPGHTGGALHVAQIFRERGARLPPVAEFSTLTYVARKLQPDAVTITGAAKRVRASCLPGGDEALAIAGELYPAASFERDVLATSLANVNQVLHTPGAILGAAWVEATGGGFRFYVDGMTPGVVRVIEALDRERVAVAAAFGHDLPPLGEEMAAIGTVDPARLPDGLRVAIAGGEANSAIRAPDSLSHRYYLEDFGFGLVPLVELAAVAGVSVPLARALVCVASSLLGDDLLSSGLTAERLGISGLSLDEVVGLVRGVETPA